MVMLPNEQDFIISARNFLLPTGNYEALGNASRWYVFKGFTADIIDWWEIRSVTYLQLLKNSKKDWRGTRGGGGGGEHQINYLDTKQIWILLQSTCD